MLKKQTMRGGKTPLNSNSYDDLQHLVVDTSLFSATFQSALISALSNSLGDFDSHINGTLIHSDNFQALNLLQARYRERVKCIYIDPPYNTGNDGFIYKDGYQSSSWGTLIHNRLTLAKSLLNQSGVIFQSIDDNEQANLKIISDGIFGKENFIANFIWEKTFRPSNFNKTTRKNTEYILSYSPNENIELLGSFEDSQGDFSLTKKKHLTHILQCPANYVHATFNDGIYKSGDYGSGYKLLNDITVKNGKVTNAFQIEIAMSIWSQSHLEKEIKLGVYLALKNSKTMVLYARKIYKQNELKPTTLLPNNLVGDVLEANKENVQLFSESKFDYPKPSSLIGHLVTLLQDNQNTLILDYFAGSGTTAHAVINLNREDKGKRQYILVEQGEYFDTVLKPRVQKVIYSKAWKDGKPVAEDGAENLQGVPQIVKVLKLESYEDTLNNLELRRSDLLDRLSEPVQHDYLLHYMLNIESRDSLLNVSHFEKPFDYGLNISTTSAGAYDWQKVDLVETFNYLIGANIISVDDKRDEQGFVAIECRLPNQSADEKTLIFWRDCERVGYDGLQKQFDRLGINPADSEYSQVYVNGDHTLETVWDGEQSGSLKIISIEDAFLSLMFEGDA